MIKFCLGLLFAISFAVPAAAQFSFGGDEDIFVDAEKATYKGRMTILEGNVDVRQGGARILSDIMHIYRAPLDPNKAVSIGSSASVGNVQRIEAEGNFSYKTPDTLVTGTRGVYVRETGIITITGDVKVKQNSGNTASTDKLIYNVKTDTIRFAGNCMGRDCKGRPSLRIK